MGIYCIYKLLTIDLMKTYTHPSTTAVVTTREQDAYGDGKKVYYSSLLINGETVTRTMKNTSAAGAKNWAINTLALYAEGDTSEVVESEPSLLERQGDESAVNEWMERAEAGEVMRII